MKWLNLIEATESLDSHSISITFLDLSGLEVKSRKLPETDKSPASETEDLRFVTIKGVPSPCLRCNIFLFLLLQLIGKESFASEQEVLAMLSKY